MPLKARVAASGWTNSERPKPTAAGEGSVSVRAQNPSGLALVPYVLSAMDGSSRSKC